MRTFILHDLIRLQRLLLCWRVAFAALLLINHQGVFSLVHELHVYVVVEQRYVWRKQFRMFSMFIKDVVSSFKICFLKRLISLVPLVCLLIKRHSVLVGAPYHQRVEQRSCPN